MADSSEPPQASSPAPAPPKAAPRRSPTSWFGVAVLAAHVIAGLYAHLAYARELFDPSSRHSLLFEPPAVARERGVVLGEARLTADGGRIPCRVRYKAGKKQHTAKFFGGGSVELLDGTSFALASDARLYVLGDARARPEPAWEAQRRTELGLSQETSASFECIGPGDPIYVEACATAAGALVACPDDDDVFVAMGRGFGPLARRRASEASAWLGLGALGLVAALALTWTRRRLDRPIVGRLAAHERAVRQAPPPRDLFAFVLVGTVLLMAALVVALVGRSGLYLVPMAAVLSAGALAFYLLAVRYRSLGAALSVVRGMSTARIADSQQTSSELELQVDPEAPLVEPLRGKLPTALVTATIHEVIATGTGKSKKLRRHQLARLVEPRWLRVRDASSDAVLDMRECELDVPAKPPIESARSLTLPPWVEAALPSSLVPEQGHERYVVEWSTLSPGDPLLVYGAVRRAQPSEVDAELSHGVGYRGAATVLAIDGPTVAVRATEAALERALSRERRAVLPICLALLLVAATALAATLHAATLP